jgi:protein-S-isoprenylcysteine O-methyltransferase Ste14
MGIRAVSYITIPLMYGGLAVVMHVLAGTWDLPFVWAVFGAQIVVTLVGVRFLDPDMIRERLNPPKGQDKDPLGRAVLTLLCFAHFGAAAYDLGRWHISDNVPVLLQVVALVLTTCGWAGLVWSMAANKFFSVAIRLQSDRGQTVVTSGPYQWIRHPGYAFASLGFLFEGVAFGSWLSVLPALAVVGYLAFRTNLEERLLTHNLDGYKEYAQRVRFRWIPGVW